MDKKISLVLSRIEKQEKSELDAGAKIPHLQRIQAITPKIGSFYNILLRAINAKHILEIGTSSGYSTIWFAEALPKNTKSKIISIENNPKKIQLARENFEESGMADKIEIRQGDALDVLAQITNDLEKTRQKFDFIFIDADKDRYIQYFDVSLPLLRIGGLICADNILFPKKFNNLMKLYLSHIKSNPKVISQTIPIDNGEEITIKIRE